MKSRPAPRFGPRQWLGYWASQKPNDLALVLPQEAETPRLSLDFATFDQLIKELSAMLPKASRPGAPCFLLIKDNALLACYQLALDALGYCIAPLNPRWSTQEIQVALKQWGCELLVQEADTSIGFLAEQEVTFGVLSASKAQLHHLIDEVKNSNRKAHLLQQNSVHSVKDFALAFDSCIDSTWDTWLLFSSGTSASPKAVRFGDRQIRHSAKRAAQARDLDGSASCLHLLPLFHIAGLEFFWSTLFAGGSQILPARFKPAQAIALLKEEKASLTMVVPTMLQALLTELGENRLDTELNYLCCGGAPTPALLIAACQQKIKGKNGSPVLSIAYGMTENGGLLTHLLPAELNHATLYTSVGKSVIGNELRINPDGLLEARSEAAYRGYLDSNALQTETTFKRDDLSWFSTGDYAVMGNHGMLQLSDRVEDRIITGGENVSPLAVERVLEAQPEILEAAVVGIEHEYWGQEVVAYIVPREPNKFPESDLDSWKDYEASCIEVLKKRCRESMPSYAIPKQFRWVSQLPRNPTGKLLRHRLLLAK